LFHALVGLALRLLDLVLLLTRGLLAFEGRAALGQTTLIRILGSSSSGAPRLTFLR